MNSSVFKLSIGILRQYLAQERHTKISELSFIFIPICDIFFESDILQEQKLLFSIIFSGLDLLKQKI